MTSLAGVGAVRGRIKRVDIARSERRIAYELLASHEDDAARDVTASSSSNEIDPALFEQLGRVVYQWAFVEKLLVMFLAFLLRADQGLAYAVSSNIVGSRLTDCIRRAGSDPVQG